MLLFIVEPNGQYTQEALNRQFSSGSASSAAQDWQNPNRGGCQHSLEVESNSGDLHTLLLIMP